MISTVATKGVGLGLGTGATLGVAAAAFAAEQLLKHYIGRGRRAASGWTGGANGQDDFQKNVLEPAAIVAQQDPEAAAKLVAQAWPKYLEDADAYAQKGGAQEKVIQQNLTTPAFMNTVRSLLREDPLSAKYTSAFSEQSPAADANGNIISRSLGKVVGGLAKILPNIVGAPTQVKGTPPYVPGSTTPSTGAAGSPGATPTNPSLRDTLLSSGIQAGALAGSGILGSRLAKSPPTALEQAQIDRLNSVGKRGEEISQNMFDMGMPAVRQPVDYWSSILSGNRNAITAAMAPEVSRIGQGYQAAAQTSAALNPRGGPTPDFLAEQPYNQQRDVSTLFQQFRPQAATQLAGAGSNLLRNSIDALYGSTAAGRDILTYEQQRRQRDRDAGEKLGGSIFDMLVSPSDRKNSPGLIKVLGSILNNKKMPGTDVDIYGGGTRNA